MTSSLNVSACLAVCRERAAEYADRAAELEACTARRDEARGKHEALRKQRLDEFMAGFNGEGAASDGTAS